MIDVKMASLTGLVILSYYCCSEFGVCAEKLGSKEDMVSLQQKAVAGMQQSLARQRESIRKQSGQVDAGDFFVLPAPAKIGDVLPVVNTQPDCEPLPEPTVRSLINEAAQREGLDAELLSNVMRQESAFRPCAVSAKGAMGLMQLMPATIAQFGVADAFDPHENVNAGAKLLKELLNRYGGDVFRALSAYNAGPARVDNVEGVPPIPETIDYINRILYSMPPIQ